MLVTQVLESLKPIMLDQQVVFEVGMDRAFVPFASKFLPAFIGTLSVSQNAIRIDIQSQRAQTTALGKLGDISVILSHSLHEKYGSHVVVLKHAEKIIQPCFVSISIEIRLHIRRKFWRIWPNR
jgi:hypothetical protein